MDTRVYRLRWGCKDITIIYEYLWFNRDEKKLEKLVTISIECRANNSRSIELGYEILPAKAETSWILS
jgi:hypothetical protein